VRISGLDGLNPELISTLTSFHVVPLAIPPAVLFSKSKFLKVPVVSRRYRVLPFEYNPPDARKRIYRKFSTVQVSRDTTFQKDVEFRKSVSVMEKAEALTTSSVGPLTAATVPG
jgi:hypothetical protein